MRLRNVKGASKKIEQSPYIINNYKDYKGNFSSLFLNNNPINIEIGMGKGLFIINMAKNNPDINYIGIEKFDSVMVRAIEKLESENIPNLSLNNIVFKTDNRKLFEYSLKSFTDYGYQIKTISLDLHNDEIPNVETEYEIKFSSKGYPIYMVDVIKK